MMYRYGDATPFPLDENFIDTLTAATDCCVSLFQADVSAEERRRKVDGIRRLADEEMMRLNVLGRAVEASLQPMLPDGKAERTSEATANKISSVARNQIKNARANVQRRRDAAVRAALGRQLSDSIYDALSEMMLDNQLPRTKWTIRWLFDNEHGVPQIFLESRTTACELVAHYSCELPPQHRWSGPIRVSDLTPDLEIELLSEGGLFRRGKKVRPHGLGKYYITETEHSPRQSSFVLRTSYKKSSPGFIVVMREEDQALPRLTRINADGSRQGAAFTISGDSAVALGALWERIEHGLHDVRRHRDAILSAWFEDQTIEKLDEPAALSEAILETLAPLIREMRLRSRVPGELVLKRDRGDGRREELFVPRAQLEAKFEPLPDRHRRVFEAVGLSSEATTEFVGREFPLAVPAGHQTPPPVPARSKPRGSSPPPPPPRKQTMSSLPDLPVPPPEETTTTTEATGKSRADTDAVTMTA